jgi:hypothetical protein
MGDFNAPDIVWLTLCGESHYSINLCDFVFDINFFQVVLELKGNILDIVLTTLFCFRYVDSSGVAREVLWVLKPLLYRRTQQIGRRGYSA